MSSLCGTSNRLIQTTPISYDTTVNRCNEQDGASVPTSHVATLLFKLSVIHRESAPKGRPKLAFPSRPIDQPQHRTRNLPRWNCFMVHRKRHVQGMEIERISSMDPR